MQHNTHTAQWKQYCQPPASQEKIARHWHPLCPCHMGEATSVWTRGEGHLQWHLRLTTVPTDSGAAQRCIYIHTHARVLNRSSISTLKGSSREDIRTSKSPLHSKCHFTRMWQERYTTPPAPPKHVFPTFSKTYLQEQGGCTGIFDYNILAQDKPKQVLIFYPLNKLILFRPWLMVPRSSTKINSFCNWIAVLGTPSWKCQQKI